MSTKIKRTRLLITIGVFLLLAAGTAIAIQLAKGYRPRLGQLTLEGTGLLSATSYPKNANVFINDRLTTVTDDTLNLTPDEYEIKIIKTGFHAWSKTLPIKPELVTTTDARLFPSIPSTTPLTFYKVTKPLISPDGNKLAYILTGSPFNQDNGIYILSLSGNLLLGNQITQISDLSTYDYTKAELLWSPDGSQILAVFHDNQRISASHLLNPRTMNQTKNLVDATIRLPLLLSTWQDQLATVNQINLARLPELIANIATGSATNVYFSPDREKLLYTVTKNKLLPEKLVETALPSINPARQQRTLSEGKTYIYDLKEDSNFEISEAKYVLEKAVPIVTPGFVLPPPAGGPAPMKDKQKPAVATEIATIVNQIKLLRGQTDSLSTGNLIWYPTNRHLVATSENAVSVIEYDGNNLTPIFSAQISENLALPSPEGSRLIILTNFNQKPDSSNLLSLDLK